ncbi:MAG: 6-carboxytetrahydropterin synthase [Bacteroidota bacterium]
MYAVKIRRHILIAHSLKSPAFGMAQNLHGATYVVDAEFQSPRLDENNIVIDIELASRVLQEALQPLNYQNLDDLPQFQGKLTTTEFLAKHIHEEVSKRVQTFFDGNLKITLGESHVAWASFEGEVNG